MREPHGELEARIGLLTRELNEAFERETATDELLRVIASSPTDIKPVLDAVAASAARLCDAYDVIIRLKKDDMLHLGAHSGPIAVDEARIEEAVDVREFAGVPIPPHRDLVPVALVDRLTRCASSFPTCIGTLEPSRRLRGRAP